MKYQFGITKLPLISIAPRCADVQSVNCINCPPFGSSCNGTNHLFTNQAKSSTNTAVIRFAQPRTKAFLLFLPPNNLKLISSKRAAKLMRAKIKSIGNRWYWYILPIIGFVSLLRSNSGWLLCTLPFEIRRAGSLI